MRNLQTCKGKAQSWEIRFPAPFSLSQEWDKALLIQITLSIFYYTHHNRKEAIVGWWRHICLQNRVRLRPWRKTFMKAATWCVIVLSPCNIYNNGAKEDHILFWNHCICTPGGTGDMQVWLQNMKWKVVHFWTWIFWTGLRELQVLTGRRRENRRQEMRKGKHRSHEKLLEAGQC